MQAACWFRLGVSAISVLSCLCRSLSVQSRAWPAGSQAPFIVPEGKMEMEKSTKKKNQKSNPPTERTTTHTGRA